VSGQDAERDELARLIAQLPDRAVRTAGDEVAFDSAWEIRAFALAVAAHQNGQYDWEQFQSALIDSIHEWEQHDTGQQPWYYYDHWLNALESLLTDSGVVGTSEVDERTHTVLATPRDLHHQRAKREPVAVDRGVAV
jgi:nitrile hydratase accessory protein